MQDTKSQYSGECGGHALPVSAASLQWRNFLAISGLVILLQACYSPERDLIQDPRNTPLIHILTSDFRPASGGVNVRWEYLGIAPLHRVVLLRRNDGLIFDSIGVMTDGMALGDSRLIDSFIDPSPASGELIEYSVIARTDQGSSSGRAVQVQIPGARLVRLRRNPFQGRIQIDWESVGAGLTGFEVVRRTPSGSRSLLLAAPSVDTYLDLDIEGNTPYEYEIRTTVSAGATLTSASQSTEVYSLARTEPVSLGRVGLATGSSVSSITLYALVPRTFGIDLSSYRYFFGSSFDGSQTVGAIREETNALEASDVDVATLQIAGPTVFRPATVGNCIYLAGTNASGDQVTIRAFSLPNLTAKWKGPLDWPLSGGAVVSAAQAGDGNLYVSGGGSLRVYTPQNAELVRYGLSFSDPTNLAGDASALWAVLGGEGRVVRSDISAGLGQTINWEEVTFPISLVPTCLTLNRFSQIFVLDATAQCVHAFDIELSHLLSWTLPEDDYHQGGLSLDGGPGNLIHVFSSKGNVYTYLP